MADAARRAVHLTRIQIRCGCPVAAARRDALDGTLELLGRKEVRSRVVRFTAEGEPRRFATGRAARALETHPLAPAAG